MVILSNQSVRMYSILTGERGVDVCIHVSYLRLQEEREPSSQSPPSERSLLPDTQTTLHIGNIVPVGEKCMFGKRLHKLASFVPPFHNFTLSLITVSNTVSWSSFKCFCPVRWGMNCRCRIKWFFFFYTNLQSVCPKGDAVEKHWLKLEATTVSTTRLRWKRQLNMFQMSESCFVELGRLQ